MPPDAGRTEIERNEMLGLLVVQSLPASLELLFTALVGGTQDCMPSWFGPGNTTLVMTSKVETPMP